MRRSKRIRQNLVLLLVSILVMIGVLEVLLRVVDPLGVDALVTTLWRISEQLDPDDPRGFGLPPGHYRFPGWTLTMDENRNRVTPDANASDCDIVFVGDSVTIGQGVQNNEVWVNLLAADADAEFINAGFSGYNVYQVSNTISNREADGYVYLLIGNDAERSIPFEQTNIGGLQSLIQRRALRAIYSYITLVRSGRLWGGGAITDADLAHSVAPSEEAYEAFLATFDPIVNREDVLVIGFASEPLVQTVAERYDNVVLVNRYTEVISWMDAHASAAGNVELAANVREPIMQFVNDTCP